MPNLSDLFSAGGFLKWDGAGNTDADYASNTAAELAADAAFTGAFASTTDSVLPGVLKDRARLSKGGVIGTGGKAAVALRFDDWHEDFNTTIYPLLKARGLPAGFATISDLTSQPWSDGVTSATVKTWNQNGVEIWSHGADHNDPRYPSYAGVTEQIVDSKATIEGWGVKCQGWMHPGATPQYAGDPYGAPSGTTWEDPTDFDSANGRLIRQTYPLIEMYMEGAYRLLPTVGADGLDHITVSDGISLADAKAHVDLATRRGLGIEFMCHSGNLGSLGMSVADFTSFLDYIVTKWNAGDLVVLTPSGLHFADPGVSTRLNLIDPTDGDFDATTYWNNIGAAGVSVETSDGPNGTTNHLRIASSSATVVNQRFGNLDSLHLQGETFLVEAWARTSGASTTVAQMVLQSYPSTTHLNLTPFLSCAPAEGWKRFRYAFTVPPASTGNIEVLIGFKRSSGDGVDWGNIRVLKV